ncbi:MAG: hypothetical protein ACRDJ4_11260 [Actinomycetota bacterium]
MGVIRGRARSTPSPARSDWPALPRWKVIAQARGLVHVPPGMDVGLQVSPEASVDLSPLGAGRPPDLQALWAAGTRATDAALAPIAGLRSLRMLDLWAVPIGDAALHHVCDLSSLEVLDLWGTRVRDPGVAELSGLRSLRRLHLPATITGEALVHLAPLESLEYLDLSGCLLNDESIRHLCRLRRLRTLLLWGSGITDDALGYLATMEGLREIDLGGTFVTQAGLGQLRALSSLRNLHLRESLAGTTEGATQLRRLLPYCRIYTSFRGDGSSGSVAPAWLTGNH